MQGLIFAGGRLPVAVSAELHTRNNGMDLDLPTTWVNFQEVLPANGYKWAIDLLFKELRVSATFKVPQHSLAGHF